MNGRVYDPVLGRFLSADPAVQFPDSTQGLNRYTYVNNNPLSFTDPSGFGLFSSIVDFVASVVKSVVNVVKKALQNQFVRLIGNIVAAYVVGPVGAAAFSGFSTLANGGDIGDALLSAATTYAFIRVTAGIGDVFGHNAAFRTGEHFSKILAHGVAGGVRSELSGGKFKSGFLAGAVTAFGGPLVGGIGGKDVSGVLGRTAVSAVIGGASAQLGGGKFINGALTGAFQRLYNDEIDLERSNEFRNEFSRVKNEFLRVFGLEDKLVIGEKMDTRVIPYARQIDADWYAPPSLEYNQALHRNIDFIIEKMDQGFTIIDIGPRPGNPNYPYPTSDFYFHELEHVYFRGHTILPNGLSVPRPYENFVRRWQP